MARPEFEVNARMRNCVKQMTAAGLTQEEQASLLGVSRNTLRKHFEVELATGRADMVSQLYGKTFESAMSDGDDSRSDRQFLLKTRGNFKETSISEHAGSIEVQQVVRKIIKPK